MLRTENAYDDPSVRQLVVFMQNRVGQFREVLKHLEGAGVVVHAISVTDSADFAILRLVVDRVDDAARALTANGFAHSQSVVLAVELENDRKGLLEVCRSLIRAEININYAYAFVTRPKGKAVVALHVDAITGAVEVLRKNGFTLIDEQELGPN